MHDLGLGGPVPVERDPDAKHKGTCFDGVYGCHLCYNAENDGKGTISECDWCHAKDVYTKVTRAWDEPVLYAICEPCADRQAKYIAQEIAWDDAHRDDDYDGGYEDE